MVESLELEWKLLLKVWQGQLLHWVWQWLLLLYHIFHSETAVAKLLLWVAAASLG